MSATKLQQKRRLALAIAIIIIVIITLILWHYGGPLFSLLQDPTRTRQIIANAGPWGPVVFILMQITQILVAPIPGQVIGLAGGYLFGAFWGTVYALIGSSLGFTLVFLLVRWLGRPFVELFVDKKLLAKFDYLAETKGTLVFFLIFLLPALPDDAVCFIAGLTTIPLGTLLLISVIGRLPGYLVLALVGSGIAESNATMVAVIVAIAAVAAVITAWQHKRIERFIKKLSR